MEVLVVGAGLAGCTCANLLAKRGHQVELIDKASEVGGICQDFLADDGTCYIQKFGPHIFHTADKEVWDYLSAYTEFTGYRHTYAACAMGKLYPFPINLHTIQKVFGRQVFSREEAEKLMFAGSTQYAKPTNFEQAAINDIGSALYTLFIKDYTEKQWMCKAKDLPVEVYSRVKVRFNFNDECFQDQLQGIPKEGYTAMMKKMVDFPNVKLELETDFFDVCEKKNHDLVIYTGAVPGAKFRSTKFTHMLGPTLGWPVINYTRKEPYTRVTDFNLMCKVKETDLHHLCEERPCKQTDGCELYPLKTSEGEEAYKEAAAELKKRFKNLVLCGRMAEHKYLDMDKAVRSAIDIVEKIFKWS